LERSTLFLIALAAAGAWVFYKKVIRKEPFAKERYYLPLPDVEDWYANALEKVGALGEELREQKEAGWLAMSDEDRVAFSGAFILKQFGERAITAYNRKQRLKIGMAHYLVSETR